MIQEKVQLMIHLRVQLRDNLVCHESGKHLFEPHIVKPLHRDVITEPHVCRLMRDQFTPFHLCRQIRVPVKEKSR